MPPSERPAGDVEPPDPEEEDDLPPPDEEDLDPDWDPAELPKIYNAETLDQADLGRSQILAVRFSGEGIDRRGASLRLVSELLESLYRMISGLQPLAAGIRVQLSGAPPRIPGIEPPALQAAVAGRSITFVLGLSGMEARLLSRIEDPDTLEKIERGTPLPDLRAVSELPTKDAFSAYEESDWASSFPTVTAAHWMSEVLAADPEQAVERVQRLGSRATRDYLKLTDVFASHVLDAQFRGHDRPRAISVPSDRAWATAERLRKTETTDIHRFQVTGALYQADARNNRFRLITGDGQVITGNYLPELLNEIRDAWAKIVNVELVRIEYRWVGEEKAHKTAFELQAIIEIQRDAGPDDLDPDGASD